MQAHVLLALFERAIINGAPVFASFRVIPVFFYYWRVPGLQCLLSFYLCFYLTHRHSHREAHTNVHGGSPLFMMELLRATASERTGKVRLCTADDGAVAVAAAVPAANSFVSSLIHHDKDSAFRHDDSYRTSEKETRTARTGRKSVKERKGNLKRKFIYPHTVPRTHISGPRRARARSPLPALSPFGDKQIGPRWTLDRSG